jgi:hypothetical protein
MAEANTLANYDTAIITVVKRFYGTGLKSHKVGEKVFVYSSLQFGQQINDSLGPMS